MVSQSIKQLLRNNADAAPEQVPARGSQAVRLRLAVGADTTRTFTFIDRQGKATEVGKF